MPRGSYLWPWSWPGCAHDHVFATQGLDNGFDDMDLATIIFAFRL